MWWTSRKATEVHYWKILSGRRGHRVPSLIAVLGIAVAALSCGAASEPELPPNVVVIISDDHGWTDYGFMGSPDVRTPALDRLASQSMVYTRGYVPAPLCRPSLATIATGLYPHQHGITGNDPPAVRPRSSRDPASRAAMEAVFARNDNIAELLGRSGYASHQSGKWWEGNPLDHGFTAAMTHGDVTRRGRHGDVGLVIGREGMDPIFDFIQSTRGPGAGESQSETSGDRPAGPAAAQPFFIWYAPFLPHTPHNPPERLLAEYRQPGRDLAVTAYLAMVAWLDETVGQLCDYLDENGLSENTIVLYVADNGWLQSDEQTEQWTMRGKMSPYDSGVRSPIMIRWPGRVAPGRDDRTLVSSIDFVPTILQAAGLAPRADLPGIDLLDRAALAERDRIFLEEFAHTSVDLEKPVANLKYRAVVREDGWKLILPYAVNEAVVLTNRSRVPPWVSADPELYQVLEDPHETRNMAPERQDLVEELYASLQEWWPVPE